MRKYLWVILILLQSIHAFGASPLRWAFNALDTRYFFQPKFYCLGQNGAILSGDMARKCCKFNDNDTGVHWPPSNSNQSAYNISEKACPGSVDSGIISELALRLAYDPPLTTQTNYLDDVGKPGGGVLDIAGGGGTKNPGGGGTVTPPGSNPMDGPTRNAAVADTTGAGGPGGSGPGNSFNSQNKDSSATTLDSKQDGSGAGGGGSGSGGNGGGTGMGQTSTSPSGTGGGGTGTGSGTGTAMDGNTGSASAYGGGGGGGKGGGGDSGPDLFGAFGSLFGGKKDGSGGSGAGGEIQFGSRNPSSAGAGAGGAATGGDAVDNDPKDYFERTTVDDDIFNIIGTKYKQKTPNLGSPPEKAPAGKGAKTK